MIDLVFLEPRKVFDKMILGMTDEAIVYDQDALINYWKEEFSEGVSEEEAHEQAVEWFEYNVKGSYMGKHTPLYCSKTVFEITLESLEG